MSWLNLAPVMEEPKVVIKSTKTVKVNHSIDLKEEHVREAIFDWLKKKGQEFPSNEQVKFSCGHLETYSYSSHACPPGPSFYCHLSWQSEQVLPV
jgi:hypothetical protein